MVDTSKWLKYKMGNNSSATVHPNDKPKYTVGKVEREREREKEREEKKERSRQPLTKEQRESKRLAKMAIGAPEKEYEKGVAFNKNPDVTDGWDDEKISKNPTTPLPQSSMKQVNASGTLAIDLIKQLHANLNESNVL